jgi:hypothetical protein
MENIGIFLERGPEGPWMGHLAGLAGCCWIRDSREACIAASQSERLRFAAFLAERGIDTGFECGESASVECLEEVHTLGGAVGESGSAMALFASDADTVYISVYWPRVLCLAESIVETASSIDVSRWAIRPVPGRRSLEEVFEHLGNCVWWYCSRIDDALADWEDAGLSFKERFLAFLPLAEDFYRRYPPERASSAFVPKRHPAEDPLEPWNFGKSLRRQGEHLWEHLGYLQRDIESYRGG